MSLRPALAGFVLAAAAVTAADPPAPPIRKITPGQVIVPTEKMRRIWGELVSLDPKTRTGTFREEGTDTVMPFAVMPYAELLHHAAHGDLQDFRVGERAIFRLHLNDAGQWFWLTYIQDEMNMLNGHKEYYWVDAVDPAAGTVTFTQANADKSYVREKDLTLKTDAATRFWKGGKPASFADIKVGDKLRAKTHGVGKGKERVAWEVFLDDESLLAFQAEQQAVHKKRMADEGLPGYVDAADGATVRLTLFGEGREEAKGLKAGTLVKLAPAGVDRKPTAAPTAGKVTEVKQAGNLCKVAVTLDAAAAGYAPAGVARLWVGR